MMKPRKRYFLLDSTLVDAASGAWNYRKNTDERLTSFVGVSGSSGGIADASSSPSSAAGKSSMRFGRVPDLSQCEVPFNSADAAGSPPPPPPEANVAKSEVLVSHRDPPCCHLDEG